MSALTRILVVDDHPLVRAGIVELIGGQKHLVVCGEAGDQRTATTAVEQIAPDLVLLDLFLQNRDGLSLIKDWLARFPDLRILVLSAHDEAVYAGRVLRAGARGYIMKIEAPNEVLDAIDTVLGGELYVSRRIAVLSLGQMLSRKNGPPSDIDRLSDRELHVFQLLGAGMPTRQVASELRVSGKTIESHRENIKTKLGLPDSHSLIERAIRWVHSDR